MEGSSAVSGQNAYNGAAASARQFAVTIEGAADGGPARRIVEPSRLLRLRSLLHATYEQIDRADPSPEGMPRVQRQLQVIRRELEGTVSPALADELRRILPPRDEAPSAGALRIECTVLLSWADGLVVEMLSTLGTAHERLAGERRGRTPRAA